MNNEEALPTVEVEGDAPLSDVAIMQWAQSDPTQFAQIYERYFSRIYAYCVRHTGNRDEGEDLASLVFINAFRNLSYYRGGSVAAWLFRIAHGTVANHFRSSRPEVSFEDREIEADILEPLESIVRAETHRTLHRLIASLPKDEQKLLALKIDAGLNSQEIAELLGKSPGAVRIKLHRVIKRLRRQFYQAEERR